jgi:type IV secretory pathway VirB2 component (pilin)
MSMASSSEKSRRSFAAFMVLMVSVAAGSARAQQSQQPTLDEVFQSVQGSMKGDFDPTQAVGLLLAVLALGMMILAVRFWSKKRSTPTVLKSQKSLMREASRAVGLPGAQLKQLQPLAEEEGLSSPLVAVICPSVLKRLAARARTEKQRQALAELARQMSKGA